MRWFAGLRTLGIPHGLATPPTAVRTSPSAFEVQIVTRVIASYHFQSGGITPAPPASTSTESDRGCSTSAAQHAPSLPHPSTNRGCRGQDHGRPQVQTAKVSTDGIG